MKLRISRKRANALKKLMNSNFGLELLLLRMIERKNGRLIVLTFGIFLRLSMKTRRHLVQYLCDL